jgi:hypothetical protein
VTGRAALEVLSATLHNEAVPLLQALNILYCCIRACQLCICSKRVTNMAGNQYTDGRNVWRGVLNGLVEEKGREGEFL